MIELPAPTENLLLRASCLAGQSNPVSFLDHLLIDFLEDYQDAKAAEAAYSEFLASGEKGIPLAQVLADNGL